jgi:hypothetical protein
MQYLFLTILLICRLLLEDNPFLTSVPYVVGCQQSLLSYSNQATKQKKQKAEKRTDL